MSGKKLGRFDSLRGIGDWVRSHPRQRQTTADVDVAPAAVLRRSSLVMGHRTAMDKRKSVSTGDVVTARDEFALVVAELKSRQQEQPGVQLRRPIDVSKWPAGTRSKSYLYPRGAPTAPTASRAVARCAKEGQVGRVKIAEREARLPKHWSNEMYVFLTEEKLLYVGKEQSAVREAATGGLLPEGGGVALIHVDGALVKQTSAHSTKKNVLEVRETEPNGRLLLLQNDDSSRTKQWYEVLYKTASRGGSLDRSRKATATSTPVTDKNVRTTIGRLFGGGGRRPTREALETRGIYRDEPVFGSRLVILCRDSHDPPPFVSECTAVLGRAPHVLQVGLYRTSGNLSHIQRLRLRVDQGDMAAVAREQDTDVLAGALKLFFRELREPLLPYDTYVRLLQLTEAATPVAEDGGAERVRVLLASLPGPHHVTLAALCRHLARVIEHGCDNQMTATSMAIVWGPSFTWPEETTQDAIVHCTRINRVVEYLLVRERQLFG